MAAAGAASAFDPSLPFPDIQQDTVLLFLHGALLLDCTTALDDQYTAHHPPPVAALPTLAAPGEASTGRSWARVVETNALPPSALRLAALVRAAPLFHCATSSQFHCGFCDVPCPGWGVHTLNDCPLLPFALLHAFRSAAAVLVEHGHRVAWSSATAFTANQTPCILSCDPDLLPSRRDPHLLYISWSGLVYPAQLLHLPPALHDLLSATFLESAACWLANPESRWRTSTPPSTGPGPSTAACDLATVLQWLLCLPTHSISGPWAATVGRLRPHTPVPPGQRPLLSCGALYHGPHPNPISVLPARPQHPYADLEVLHLPMGIVLTCAPGRLPVALRRLLDTLFPPPDVFCDPSLWERMTDPGETPADLPDPASSDEDVSSVSSEEPPPA